jgi:hypothetical protein
MSYDEFKMKVADALRNSGKPLTWTEVRILASLPQPFPNDQWVRRMETDIGLSRRRQRDGIIRWQLSNEPQIADTADTATGTAKAPNKIREHSRRKQGA